MPHPHSKRITRIAFVVCAVLVLAACSSTPKRGGYYQGDGPPTRTPDNIEATPDAMPRVEALRAANIRPYSTLGRDYVPLTSLRPFRQRGLASWYGKQFHGMPTATGEPYDMMAMTAAHTTLPLPCYVRVTSVRNGRSVIVRVNDRGPFFEGRIIDLSYAAAVKLGGPNVGTQEVEIELLLPDEIARIQALGHDTRVARAGTVEVGAIATSASATIRPATAQGDDMAALILASGPTAANTATTTSAIASVPSLAPMTPLDAPDATPVSTPPVVAPLEAQAVAEKAASTEPAGPRVQAGAFAQRSNADTLRDRVMNAMPDLAGKVNVVQRGNLYRVLIGPFEAPSAEALASIQTRLRNTLGMNSVVIDRN
jgi:rare lipoprotein A